MLFIKAIYAATSKSMTIYHRANFSSLYFPFYQLAVLITILHIFGFGISNIEYLSHYGTCCKNIYWKISFHYFLCFQQCIIVNFNIVFRHSRDSLARVRHFDIEIYLNEIFSNFDYYMTWEKYLLLLGLGLICVAEQPAGRIIIELFLQACRIAIITITQNITL